MKNLEATRKWPRAALATTLAALIAPAALAALHENRGARARTAAGFLALDCGAALSAAAIIVGRKR